MTHDTGYGDVEYVDSPYGQHDDDDDGGDGPDDPVDSPRADVPTHPPPSERGFNYGYSLEDGDRVLRTATYGAPDGSTYGPQTESEYRVELISVDGRSITLSSVLSVDLRLEHTGPSDVSVKVPRLSGLADFRLGRLRLFYGDIELFRARVERFPGPGSTETAELYGRGPGRELTRGAISVTYAGVNAYEAIEEVWSEYTSFEATVTTPFTTTTLTDFEAEGTPLEVLQKLHEIAGMRFTVQHTADSQAVESYVPEERPQEESWTAIEHDSEGDVSEYANAVEVYGGMTDSDARAFGRAADQAEIDRVGEEPVRIDDRTLTTDADCRARARSALANHVDTDTLSGDVTIIPELVLPGYQYSIPEWEREDGTIPQLPVDRVQFQEGVDEGTATLEIAAPDGVTDVLTALQRETAQLNQP